MSHICKIWVKEIHVIPKSQNCSPYVYIVQQKIFIVKQVRKDKLIIANISVVHRYYIWK